MCLFTVATIKQGTIDNVIPQIQISTSAQMDQTTVMRMQHVLITPEALFANVMKDFLVTG